MKNPTAVGETWVLSLGWDDPPEKGMATHSKYSWASPVAQLVKNPSAMQETWVQSLGWKDPLEERIATHSSFLAWRILMDRGAWRATVHVFAKS